MQITSLVEARRQEDQGLNHLFKYIFVATVVYVSNGEGKHLECLWVIWYVSVRLGGVSESLIFVATGRFRNLRGDPSASIKNAFKSLILVQNLQDRIEGLPEVELS
ncbi:hypothetical protein GQ457_16G017090 [Hibiscus cannabinus]